MATVYVNINNSYSTSGDGTIGNQYNWDQMILPANAANFNGNTVLIQGYRTLTSSDPAINAFTGMFPWNTYDVNAQNLASPWKIKSTSRDIYIGGMGPSFIKNGIINVISSYLQPGRNDVLVGALSYENMVLKGYGAPMQFAPQGATLSLKGCTIESDTVLNIAGYASGDLLFENSIIKAPDPVDWSYANPNLVQTTFRNCVSTVDLSLVPNSSGSGTSQSSWTPATSLPTTDSTQADFLEQTVAPDLGANDITVAAYTVGSFSGYTSGLFGGKLRTSSHGIGALYFGTPFKSRPASVIPASRKFIYQPAVDGTPTLYTLSGQPSGMTVNGSTGRIEWTPSVGTTTSGAVTLDADGTSQVFTIAVNTPPRIISTAPNTSPVGVFNYQAVVTDAEGGTMTYALINAPGGMTIDSNGLVSATLTAGTYQFKVKVSDSYGLFDAQAVALVVS